MKIEDESVGDCVVGIVSMYYNADDNNKFRTDIELYDGRIDKGQIETYEMLGNIMLDEIWNM